MTALERLKYTNPNKLKYYYIGGAYSCPSTYFNDSKDFCSPDNETDFELCKQCWQQNLPPIKVKVYNKRTGEILQCSKKP